MLFDLCITTLDYDAFIQVSLFFVFASELDVTMVTEVVCCRCYEGNTSSFSVVPLHLTFYTSRLMISFVILICIYILLYL